MLGRIYFSDVDKRRLVLSRSYTSVLSKRLLIKGRITSQVSVGVG